MKAKTKMIIASLVIVVAIAAMMAVGFNNTSGRAVTIEQVMSPNFEYSGQFLRTEGELLEGFVFNAQENVLTFQVSDGERVLDVTYDGFQPDNFYAGVEVILTGQYLGEGKFQAETVQTRCPSTYEPEIHAEGGEQQS